MSACRLTTTGLGARADQGTLIAATATELIAMHSSGGFGVFIYILGGKPSPAGGSRRLCAHFGSRFLLHFFFVLHIFATAANASLWSAFGFFFFHPGSSFFMKRLYADGGRGTLSFLAEPFLADFFADFLAIAFFGADFFAGAFCIIEKLRSSHHCSKDLCAKHLRNASQKECLDVGGIVTVIFTTRFARVFTPC